MRRGRRGLEPPESIHYSLDEALTHLAVVVGVEAEDRVLSRKLGFRDPEGDGDGH